MADKSLPMSAWVAANSDVVVVLLGVMVLVIVCLVWLNYSAKEGAQCSAILGGGTGSGGDADGFGCMEGYMDKYEGAEDNAEAKQDVLAWRETRVANGGMGTLNWDVVPPSLGRIDPQTCVVPVDYEDSAWGYLMTEASKTDNEGLSAGSAEDNDNIARASGY
jgi:hypothetical protein